ncbi:MAG TPA: hypothetical protein PK397_12845 [Ignavibacteriaceae bacterium]|nr:hypothetical protein [Ignavibacteriaceae bacterium]
MYNPKKTFGLIKEVIHSLEALLSENKIIVESNSQFENVYLLADNLDSEDFIKICAQLKIDEDEAMAQIMGCYHISQLIKDLSSKSGFDVFRKHLNLLGSSSFVQNVKASVTDSGSNKVLELLFGLGAFAVGENLKLDDPENSKGDNPDIIVDLDNHKWGFACKVISGDNPQTLYQNFEKAVEQIEKSDAEIGITVLNYKNKFPSSELIPRDTSSDNEKKYFYFLNHYAPVEIVIRFVHKKIMEMIETVGSQNINNLFSNKKTLPGCIVFNQNLTTSENENVPTYTINTFLQLIPFNTEKYWNNYELTFGKINDSFHNIY